jgi:hypothetical protein
MSTNDSFAGDMKYSATTPTSCVITSNGSVPKATYSVLSKLSKLLKNASVSCCLIGTEDEDEPPSYDSLIYPDNSQSKTPTVKLGVYKDFQYSECGNVILTIAADGIPFPILRELQDVADTMYESLPPDEQIACKETLSSEGDGRPAAKFFVSRVDKWIMEKGYGWKVDLLDEDTIEEYGTFYNTEASKLLAQHAARLEEEAASRIMAE